jgi:hypothetical protein
VLGLWLSSRIRTNRTRKAAYSCQWRLVCRLTATGNSQNASAVITGTLTPRVPVHQLAGAEIERVVRFLSIDHVPRRATRKSFEVLRPARTRRRLWLTSTAPRPSCTSSPAERIGSPLEDRSGSGSAQLPSPVV